MNLKEKIQKIRKNLILANGVYVFENAEDDVISEIFEIASEYDDIVPFTIEYNDDKLVVLRYVNIINEINIPEILKQGNNAYYEGNIKKCIKLYKKILSTKNPMPYVYGNLGLYYFYEGKKDTALKYLKIASYLSRNKSENIIYETRINMANGLISQSQLKTYVDMNEKDFENDRYNFFNIDNIHEIERLICDKGLSFFEACDRLNIPEEDRVLISIIFARESYYQSEYKLGDMYLKIAETSKNKSEIAKKLLEEVRKNKKFYKNRTNEEKNVLTLRKREI